MTTAESQTGVSTRRVWRGWVWVRRGVLAVLLVAAVWLLWSGVPRVCHDEATDAGAIQVCALLPATDVRVLLFLLVVAVLLLPELSEVEFAGLVTLKRDVAQAKEDTARTQAAVEQLRIEVTQRQSQSLSVSVDARQAGTGAALESARGDGVDVQPTASDEVSQLAYQAGTLGLAELVPASARLRTFLAVTWDPSGIFLPAQVVPPAGDVTAALTWLNQNGPLRAVTTEVLMDGTRFVAAPAGDVSGLLGALVVHVEDGHDPDGVAAYLGAAADAYALLLRGLLGERP